MEENRQVSFKMTIDDVYAVSRGALIGRPEALAESLNTVNKYMQKAE
jgi:hypothetical protein